MANGYFKSAASMPRLLFCLSNITCGLITAAERMKSEKAITAHQGRAPALHMIVGAFFIGDQREKGKENRNFGALTKGGNTKTLPVTHHGVF
jgi:hypothetical protein